MDEVLTTRGVCFCYGRESAVADLDLTLRRGDILGFVGPNGAGKTTTIKLLLGLLTPDRGTIEAFGLPIATRRADVLGRIGALVETPAVYGHLTAAENLELQRVAHRAARSRIRDVLELVSLQDAGRKPVKHFSLGMRQRLGIAIALLHRPELLVLDEPANGLDPAGIQDVRRLLQRLASEERTTILVSSHILAELEQSATTIAVIVGGRIRFSGTLEAMKASRGGVVRVVVDDRERAATALGRLGLNAEADGPDGLQVRADDREVCARVASALAVDGVKVYRLALEHPPLEELFLDIVRRHEREVAA